MVRVNGIVAGLAALVALPARAQPNHHASHAAGERSAAVAAVVSAVRDAVRPYRDRTVAVRDGYRRVGRDFPGMGQHWVKVSLLLSRFDPLRPAVLTYVEVDGRPVLTGVVLAAALDPGAAPPDVAGSEGLWHEHNGTLDEESLDPAVAGAPATGTRRLAVLHVWSDAPNPDGVYATDNWTLPFIRLGLAPPDPMNSDAGRALSLLTTPEYYVERLAALGADAGSARAALAARRGVLTRVVSALRGPDPDPAALHAELSGEWSRFARAAAALCARCARAVTGH